MSRYERVEPSLIAADPPAGARLYGLNPEGRLTVVVVEWTTPHYVFYRKRTRGSTHDVNTHGWKPRHISRDIFRKQVQATCLAVRLPRIYPAPQPKGTP